MSNEDRGVGNVWEFLCYGYLTKKNGMGDLSGEDALTGFYGMLINMQTCSFYFVFFILKSSKVCTQRVLFLIISFQIVVGTCLVSRGR